MRRYKQVDIPQASNKWNNLKLGELKKAAQSFYLSEIEGKSCLNKSTGVTISFPKSGIKHVLNFGNAGYVKFKFIEVLKKAIEVAEFKNFKLPDDDDGNNIIGYMNFNVKVKVEDKIENFRAVIRVTNDGKFYYNHSVKIKKP